MRMEQEEQRQLAFQGTIRSIQPRSTVWRYKTDNRTHRLTGYNLFLTGTADRAEKDFSVAISEKQLQKYDFNIGDEIKGAAWPVRTQAPYTGNLYDLAVYQRRGCRMLSDRRWKGKCFPCKWANMAAVTIEYNFGKTQRHRYETFCYGPEDCPLYAMGRKRGVPYIHESGIFDEGWLDDICMECRYDHGYTEEEDE